MLSIRNLSLRFRDRHRSLQVFSDFSLEVPQGKFVALLGKSGCGKSTLLRCIAGLQPATSGEILLNGEHITGTDPSVGMVFQDPCLFPWLCIEKNVAMGPRLQGLEASEYEPIVERHLRETGLLDVRKSLPKSLSGGMKQRAAIARTLSNDPQIILMDEPFSALDSFTRSSMQDFLLSLWEHGKKTILFVTHDVEEAMFLADEIVVLDAHPMRLKKRVQIPFARPRRQELKNTKEFFEMRNQLLKEF
jgi:NitT/TauT family transport system ATP-binding protein